LIRVYSKSPFFNTKKKLEDLKSKDIFKNAEQYAKWGVSALKKVTPKDSGETSKLWGYYLEKSEGSLKIVWTNDNVVGNTNVALLIQYGHGTATGQYIEGKDYINPAMDKVYDRIIKDIDREVNR
jgi:hypothetical protein